nr:hypothetical protein [Providencia stuartii]
MENYIRCPACDSTRIRERHIGKKTGAVAGGISGALAGASIGSAVPVVGTIAGAAVGALFDVSSWSYCYCWAVSISFRWRVFDRRKWYRSVIHVWLIALVTGKPWWG